jgi:hypothetical protein
MVKPARRYLLAAALPAVLAFCATAFAGGAGTTAGDFLKIPVAAIPSALGEAYTALIGPDSILYNPAALGLLGYSTFSGAHNQYAEGITQEYVSGAWRSPYGTLGAAYSTLSSGQIAAYDSYDMPIGNTSTRQSLIAVSFSQSWPHFNEDIGKLDPMLITPSWTSVQPVEDYRPKAYRISVGGTVKKISEDLGNESAATYAYDAGVMLVMPHHLQFGLSALNLGGSEKFVQETYDLPSSLRFGVAKDFHTIDDVMIFTVSSDLVKYSDQNSMGAVGLTVDIKRVFQFRLGYDSLKDAGSKLCGGFGMTFDKMADKSSFLSGSRVDYSYVDYGPLGGTHRFGVQFVW